MSSESFLLLLRLGFSLSLVFGLMWVAARVVRGKHGPLKRATTDHLEILERKALSKNSSIAIVRVAGETMTVGITDTHVTLLGAVELPEPEIDLDAPVVRLVGPPLADEAPRPVVAPSGGRRGLLDTLRDKTVRHVAG